MSPNDITQVGMDAHKNSVKVAALLPKQADALEWTEDTSYRRRAHSCKLPTGGFPIEDVTT